MINFQKKCTLFLSLLAITVSINTSVSYGAYEVVNAKTVANENEIVEEQEKYIPTFNDPELPDFSPENSISAKIEKSAKKLFSKKRKSKVSAPDETLPSEDTVADTEKQADIEIVNDKNKFKINADKVVYDDEAGNIRAKGHVEIIAQEQGVVLKADDATLDKEAQLLKLYNNVKIIKNGIEMMGEYILVDLNEQNVLMDNPKIEAYSFIINAQEGYLIANDIQMLNGTLKSTQASEVPLVTRGFMRLDNFADDFANKRIEGYNSLDTNQNKQVYKINTKEIVVTSYKDHNSLVLKGSNVYYNKHRIINNTDIEIISDKKNQVTETNAPEAGTMRNFGTYIGYGMVYRLPKGQTLKLMPVLTYGESNIGAGLIARHRSPNGMVEGGWNTSTTNFVVRGRYRLANSLELRYGRNAYMPEGFMGARRSGYAAQLQYQKSYKIEDLDAYFNHGVYAGFYSDYQKHHQESHAYATTRFRYIAEMRKDLAKYENKEQNVAMSFGAMAQTAATLYGSGETVGIARFGPYLNTKVKGWESSIAYAFAGVHGDSPFVFDKYRYGKSSIMLNEKFNFNDKFAIGYRAYFTPLKDNYEKDLLTESRLYAIFGPQDLKIALSYDFVRDVAHLDFMFLIGTDSAKIDFEKLTTKDIEGARGKRDFYKNAKRVKIDIPENI